MFVLISRDSLSNYQYHVSCKLFSFKLHKTYRSELPDYKTRKERKMFSLQTLFVTNPLNISIVWCNYRPGKARGCSIKSYNDSGWSSAHSKRSDLGQNDKKRQWYTNSGQYKYRRILELHDWFQWYSDISGVDLA